MELRIEPRLPKGLLEDFSFEIVKRTQGRLHMIVEQTVLKIPVTYRLLKRNFILLYPFIICYLRWCLSFSKNFQYTLMFSSKTMLIRLGYSGMFVVSRDLHCMTVMCGLPTIELAAPTRDKIPADMHKSKHSALQQALKCQDGSSKMV